MATPDITFSAGMEQLRASLVTGDGSVAVPESFFKACCGDIKLVCTPATVAKAATNSAWTQEVVVTVCNNDGTLCSWYNGNITLAVGDTATGTAAISPAAGAHAVTDGSLTVTLSGDAGSNYWAAASTATLTASPTANNAGLVQGSLIANATCVVSFS